MVLSGLPSTGMILCQSLLQRAVRLVDGISLYLRAWLSPHRFTHAAALDTTTQLRLGRKFLEFFSGHARHRNHDGSPGQFFGYGPFLAAHAKPLQGGGQKII